MEIKEETSRPHLNDTNINTGDINKMWLGHT